MRNPIFRPLGRLLIIGAAAFTLTAYTLAARAQVAGDPAAGADKVATCVACHGQDGNSPSPAFPKIAGQHASYTLKQLKDIQSGARSVPQMAGLLDNMSEQDLADISAFYEQQTLQLSGAVDDETLKVGERIYRAGIAEIGVASCMGCHSPTGVGNGPAVYPRLGGQYADYIVTQLKAYRDGTRANDGDAMPMRSVSKYLRDDQIEALANYISGLQP